MDIKLKYRAWMGEKHTDISNLLTNSDIETFAIEFAEWLVKNCSMLAVAEQNEQLEVFKCPNCGNDWDIEKVNSCECGASVRR